MPPRPDTSPAPGGQLTELLGRMRRGDPGAFDLAFASLHAELRRLALRHMRGESGAHTLQPTALVNEAYLRLVDGPDVINDRRHFFALASQAMRRVLVDHARQKKARKRGGGAVQVTLDGLAGEVAPSIDVLALEEALIELATVDPDAVRVVELRFFGGHTDAEVAEITGRSFPRVRRDWAFARAWLKRRLNG
ncbi:MAG: sigma-70 family RNA polymerase sigma factor [Acidobacteriota bacterium]|nr:sigma-70 family RNA polymerase sigma factor [Acidobacteriota bacterium]